MNKCPGDVAKLSFFQFLKSPLGADLNCMFHLSGQPSPDQWDVHNRWWLREREDLDDRLGRRGDAPDWPMFVVWRSKLFMHVFLDLQRKMVTNLTAVPLERIIWDVTTLRNILLELKLVSQEDLKDPKTYFQKVATMGKGYLELF